jgi:hypothetical protein
MHGPSNQTDAQRRANEALARSDNRAEARDHALNQIQTIAYDGAVLAQEAVDDPGVEGAGDDFARAVLAKLERIQHIAEAQRPDEDWRPAMEEVGS